MALLPLRILPMRSSAGLAALVLKRALAGFAAAETLIGRFVRESKVRRSSLPNSSQPMPSQTWIW
jgi:hypothetical protein